MTAGQHIDYEALELESKRGVVKACLTQIAQTGLLGDHHFYIAFKTQAPGAGLSKRLKEKYPREMTIVLQHRFWDLVVEEERFEVKLTFDGIPERLVVPFKAIKAFYDPSVPYLLQFEEIEGSAQHDGVRRATRRASARPGEADDAESARPVGAVEADGAPGDAAADRRERRRPPRPSRETPDAARRPTAAGGEIADAEETGQRETRTRLKPVDAGPTPVASKSTAANPPAVGKPALAPVSGSVDKVSPDDEAEGDKATDGNGAKIFDLSKFRGKK